MERGSEERYNLSSVHEASHAFSKDHLALGSKWNNNLSKPEGGMC